MQNSLLDLIVPTVYRYLDKIETSTEKEISVIVDFWISSESSNGDVFTRNSFEPEMNP